MPYSKLDELPAEVKALPTHGQEIWMAAFNSAFEEYKGDEEKSFATAWAAVKNKYTKKEGKWIPMGDGEPWFEIFCAGEHTDSAGNKAEWTTDDLNEIASLYNPAHHEAPIVLGHPESDSPAYGWVAGLKVEDSKLLAKPRDLDPGFVDLVKKGRYKKVSIALYPDLGLRHVGFLGAVPPAVKGMRQANFGDKKAEWIYESRLKEINMADQSQREKEKAAQETRSKKYNIAIKDGGHVTKPGEWSGVPDDEFLDPVNYRYPCPDADQTRAAAAYWGKPDNQAQYSSEEKALISRRLEAKEKQFKIGAEAPGKGGTHMDLGKCFSDLKALIVGAEKELAPDPGGAKFTEIEVQAREAKAKAEAERITFAETEKLKKEKADAEAKVKEIETKTRKDGIASFCEAQCKEGKLTPALRKIIEPIMITVSGIPDQVEFAEGVKKTALEGIKDFLSEFPKVVTFKEVTPKEGPGSGGSASEKLSVLTEKKMKEKKDLSYTQAFAEVQKENLELAREALEEIRPSAK